MSDELPQANESSASKRSTETAVDNPFITLLGFEVRLIDKGRCEMTYTPKAEHLNSFDVTHGGALMTLLDAAMAHAARSYDTAMGVVTIELKSSFMQPALGALLARGTVLHRTATLAFTEASVLNEAGEVCAHGTATFKYVKRLPAGSRQVKDLQLK